MDYKTFGRNNGLRVTELALGTGNFGTGWGHGAEPAEAARIFDGYLAAGGNFIDTADTYQGGQSEQILADLIRAERDRLVVATKYTLGVAGSNGPAQTGNSRKNMVQSVEASLARLKTERIDLYWAHFADGATPLDEIMRAFDDLVRAGKILYAGLSNFPAWRIARAATMAELRGWAPLAGIQVEYSLADRSAERELLPMVEAMGLGAALWSPLGGGFLTGKYRGAPEESRLAGLGMLVHTEQSERETAILDCVVAIAAEVDAPPLHVAIAWLMEKARRSATGLVPILGPRTRAQLDGTLGALKVGLSPAQLARLDFVSAVDPGTPGRQIAASALGAAGASSELLASGRRPAA